MEEQHQNVEHLLTLLLEDGTSIEFKRTENKQLQVCHKDHCVILAKATGRTTLDLAALLVDFGNIEDKTNGKA